MAQITRSNITAIRNDVEAALKAIYAKHGVDVTVGRITFNAESFRCKIEGIVRGAGGTNAAAPIDPRTLALTRYAHVLGTKFNSADVYKSPTLGRVRVVGYNPKAHKYPVIVQIVGTNKKYRLPTYAAKAIVEAGAVA